MINLKDKLIKKSIEAFLLGLEIYNKPTIKYRVEGFSFFICNAWELMLKAQMLKMNKSIYYKDDPSRTISLSNALNTLYPDKNTRVRLNLERIIDLRNISTHYITEDYEFKYVPLFQACVINYTKDMLKFHNVDITEYVPQNFLTISANYNPLSNEQIKLKYTPEIAEKFITKANEIDVLSDEYNSDAFSIDIRQLLYITKNKKEADFNVKIDKNAKAKASIIKELKDPTDTHKYSFNSVIIAVSTRLAKNHIQLKYDKGFNAHILNLVIKFYNVKQNEVYAYKHVIGNQEHYTYSQQFVDFLFNEIKKNPDKFVDSLKNKKITPGT